MNTKEKLIASIIVFIAGFLFQVRLQSYMRQYAIDNFYFQTWSSETLMQTVSIEDLQNAPIETLLNIHIEPPGLDLIRATIVHTLPKPNEQMNLEQYVDYWLYKIWAFLYGVLGGIVFLWIYEITRAKSFSMIATIIFLLHPACLLYATLLDSTFLTSLLVLIFYYFLWKAKNKQAAGASYFIVVLLALFFTRPIFQLPFVLVSALSLALIGMPKRNVLLVLFVTSAIVSVYMIKQYYQFGSFSTSSFTGLNLNRSVGNDMTDEYYAYLDSIVNVEKQDRSLPQTLTRERKLTGRPNFNNIAYLQLNKELEESFKVYILSAPPLQLISSYRENLQLYFAPSSKSTAHVIVNRVPWRPVYDAVFSAPILYGLILLLGVPWLLERIRLRDYVPAAGILLPGIFIFVVCVVFEKGQNMRFKFFLEPIFFVFLASQVYIFCRKVLTQRASNGLYPSHS